MDQKLLVDIRTYGQRFSNSPNEKFLLMILCSQAKLENDHKGENVKRGLRAKCELGWRPGVAPIGYVQDYRARKGGKSILIDEERAPIIRQMFEKVGREGWSGRDILDWLDTIEFKMLRSGSKMYLSSIYRILREPFYYGRFEYPRSSGVWYTGSHDPIISKELFDRVREKLDVRPNTHTWRTKEFAFTRLFTCGSCGSGITAEEKTKRQKNGNVHRYVYYHCSYGKDRNCKEKAIREEELLKQLVEMVDEVDLDEIGIRKKIEVEVERFQSFNSKVLGREEDPPAIKEVNVRRYMRYLLERGSTEEGRELLESISTMVEIRNRKIGLVAQSV